MRVDCRFRIPHLPRLASAPVPPDLPFAVQSPHLGSIEYTGHADDLRSHLQSQHVNLWVIRHGETAANVAGPKWNPILAGQSETPLTEHGRQEARQAAGQLYQDLGGDAWLRQAAANPARLPVIYAGPLSRARQTAQATVDYLQDRAKALGLPALPLAIQSEQRLTEIGFGRFEMRHGLSLMLHHPIFALTYNVAAGLGEDFLHRFPGGESRMDVMARVQSFLEDVAQQNAGRTVLLFSHNETIDGAEALLHEARQRRSGALRARMIPNATPCDTTPYRLV
ncbi:MAG: histidine phosphatase family protein [Candidatus Xenobia bacterium]